MDIEGFESRVLPELVPLARARQAVLFVELHALGMNGWGDPVRGFELLRSSGAALTDVEGRPLEGVDPSAITHVVARWD